MRHALAVKPGCIEMREILDSRGSRRGDDVACPAQLIQLERELSGTAREIERIERELHQTLTELAREHQDEVDR
jgi:hypothetical protein